MILYCIDITVSSNLELVIFKQQYCISMMYFTFYRVYTDLNIFLGITDGLSPFITQKINP